MQIKEELYIFYFYKKFSLNPSFCIHRVIFPSLSKGKVFVFSLTSLLWLFSKHFSSPLTVQDRCRCWPAPRILLLNHDSTIPHGLSSAKVENDFSTQQNLCYCQSNLSPEESILFAALFFISSFHRDV